MRTLSTPPSVRAALRAFGAAALACAAAAPNVPHDAPAPVAAELLVDVAGTAVRPLVRLRSTGGRPEIDATEACLEWGAVCDVFEVRRDGVRVPFVAAPRPRAPETPMGQLWRKGHGWARDTSHRIQYLSRDPGEVLLARLDHWYAIGAPGQYEVRYRARIVRGAAPATSDVVRFTLPGAPPPAASIPDVIAEVVQVFADPGARPVPLAARLGRLLPSPFRETTDIAPYDLRFARGSVRTDDRDPGPQPRTVELLVDERTPLTVGDLATRFGAWREMTIAPEADNRDVLWELDSARTRGDAVDVRAELQGYTAEARTRVRRIEIRRAH